MRAERAALLLAAAILVNGAAAPDRPLLDDLRWLDPKADRVAALTARIPEPLALDNVTPEQRDLVEIGRVAFRAPDLLGGIAARWGMSCQSCHVNGGRNAAFHVEGLSRGAGNFDASNGFFSKRTQNGVFDPLPIPVLYAVKNSAPYAHDGRFATLGSMVTHVIDEEFQGAAPAPLVMAGLLAYLEALKMPPPGAKPEPMTFEQAFTDLERSAQTLHIALTIEDSRLTSFLVQALRREIGRMAQHFPRDGTAQDRLALLSLALRQLGQDAEEKNFAAARQRLLDYTKTLSASRLILASRAARSLYMPRILAETLDTP